MAEISKVLAEFGMAPSIVSNIFDIDIYELYCRK